MKKTFSFKVMVLFLVLGMAVALHGCGGESDSVSDNNEAEAETVENEDNEGTESNEPIVFKFGHANSEEDNFHKGLLSFKEGVEERTNGEIVIETYPNGQLGENAEVLEQVRLGGNMMTQFSAGTAGEYVPDFDILIAPFL